MNLKSNLVDADVYMTVLIVSGFVDSAGNYIKKALFNANDSRSAWIDMQRLLDPEVAIGQYDDSAGLWATATVPAYRNGQSH